jgi:signal transduction histidine kinase
MTALAAQQQALMPSRCAATVWDDSCMALGPYSRIAITGFAAAFGVLTLAVARDHPTGSFGGASTLGGVAELGAGWSLIASGVLIWSRHRNNRCGPLLTAAGFAWFLPEWSNPRSGIAFGFTAALVGFVACTPLVAHAALAYPTGLMRSRLRLAVLTVSYGGALLLLGLLPATVFSAKATGCFECPRNLILIRGDAGLFETFNRYGLRIGIVWLTALGALLVWRLVRSTRSGAAVVLPVLLPATVYLVLVEWDFQHSLARGILSNDSFDQRLWRYEAVALVAVALGVGSALLRERQARASIARLVVELSQIPKPGAVRNALAQTLGDPTLDLAYNRPRTGRYVDAFGFPVELTPGPRQAITPMLRGDTPVAALVHDERLLDRQGLLHEVLAAARIAVENEQLQAEVRAQLEELRASRARIVETGDAERRRLERDLHDGAQQQLLAVSYDLRRMRTAAEADGDRTLTTLLAAATEEAQAALAELRELAHGIYPAILVEAGLAPALETLADHAAVPVELEKVTRARYEAPVETAAYLTAAEAIDDATGRGATHVSLNVDREDRLLVIRVRDDGTARTSGLIHLSDRIGALGGSLHVRPTSLRAEIPCA